MLPMKLDEYLELVDWSGRMLREGKRGSVPSELAPILKRLKVDEENWMNTVEKYGGWFHYAAGRAESIMKAAKAYGRQWLKGIGPSRSVFGLPKESTP